MPGDGVAVPGAGTPTGVLAEQGDTMAAEAAVAALGDGDHSNSELIVRFVNKYLFLCFFLTCCRMGLYVNLRTVFFIFFFPTNKGIKPQIKKKEVLLLVLRRFFPLVNA